MRLLVLNRMPVHLHLPALVRFMSSLLHTPNHFSLHYQQCLYPIRSQPLVRPLPGNLPSAHQGVRISQELGSSIADFIRLLQRDGSREGVLPQCKSSSGC